MKIKQKTKNWIVLITALLLFFSFYIFLALRLGKNVKGNVSQGTISMASSFLERETSSIDEKVSSAIDYFSSNSLEDFPIFDFVEIEEKKSEKGLSIDGGYLKYSNGERALIMELAPIFQFDNPLISSITVSLSGKGEWGIGKREVDDTRIEFNLEKTGLKVAYTISQQFLEANQERGITLVVSNMIYVAILFIVFIVFMAIYTFSREPFAANKNKKMVDRILSAVTDDFVFLVEVDVKTRIEKIFFVSKGPHPQWSDKKTHKYDESIKEYADVVVAPEDRKRFLEVTEFNALMEYFKNNDNECIIEYDVIVNGGRRRYQGKFTLSPQDPEGAKIYVGVRDITLIEEERTEYNRKLMSALAQAEEANKGKSYFLFNMSHDIRTPLNAIIGYSELAKNHLDEKEVLDDYIYKIQTCGRQLLGLIGDVLDMAKIESGNLEISEKPCLCQDLMSDIMISVNESAKKKGLEFEASGNACHSTILCDKVKVQKILLNILSNAVKYTPKGGKISLSVQEKIREDERLSDFTFVVKDNGIGISKEFLPYIFNSFSRERNATISGVSGTGLGMTITKRLVDAMGGKIEVESQQNMGTTVTVSITFSRLVGLEEKREEIIPDAFLKGIRVLLVEDNEINGEIASEMLRELKVNVDLVTNGKECIDALLEKDAGYYDLVLMDIQMPVMDGYEATRIIRRFSDKDKRLIPVIAMTANAFEEDKQKAFQSGMNGHLAKPVEMRHLIQALKSAIGKK
ncbi:MAG: ATP-binding protein [Spirochaetales bacterium]|nr:ATP-binding protein [Spirochaetales bacterium]